MESLPLDFHSELPHRLFGVCRTNGYRCISDLRKSSKPYAQKSMWGRNSKYISGKSILIVYCAYIWKFRSCGHRVGGGRASIRCVRRRRCTSRARGVRGPHRLHVPRRVLCLRVRCRIIGKRIGMFAEISGNLRQLNSRLNYKHGLLALFCCRDKVTLPNLPTTFCNGVPNDP